MYYGDYYRGDYYRGDPFLGGLLSAGARLVKGVAQKALGLGGPGTAVVIREAPGAIAKIARSRTGRAAAVGAAAAAAAGLGGMALFGGGGARRRRMNVLNMRALDRSIRRLTGFEKRVKKVIRFTRPGQSCSVKVRKRRKAPC